MFVQIPTLNQTSNLICNEILESAGLKTMFNESSNLDGMSESIKKVDNILHSSVFKVDENGSETDSSSVSKGESFEIPRTGGGYKFCADRPFLYFVVTCKDDKKVENNKVLLSPNNLLYVGTFC